MRKLEEQKKDPNYRLYIQTSNNKSGFEQLTVSKQSFQFSNPFIGVKNEEYEKFKVSTEMQIAQIFERLNEVEKEKKNSFKSLTEIKRPEHNEMVKENFNNINNIRVLENPLNAITGDKNAQLSKPLRSNIENASKPCKKQDGV
jgi:hypothetical protein